MANLVDVYRRKFMRIFHVIIAGGRDFNDYDRLKETCDIVLGQKVRDGYEIVIISGKARGADSLGEKYAKEKGYKIISKAADWDRYGKAAGYRRNVEMAEEADCLIAYWDQKSKGTKHMINIAEERNLQVRVWHY